MMRGSMFRHLYNILFLFLICIYIIFLLVLFIISCKTEYYNIKNNLIESNYRALNYFEQNTREMKARVFNEDEFEYDKAFNNFLLIKNNKLIYEFDNSHYEINMDLINNNDNSLFISSKIIEGELVVVKKDDDSTQSIYVFNEYSKNILHKNSTTINSNSKKEEMQFDFSNIFNKNKFSVEKALDLDGQNYYFFTEGTFPKIYLEVIHNLQILLVILLIILIIFFILVYRFLNKTVNKSFAQFIDEIEILEENELNTIEVDENQAEYFEFAKIFKVLKNICFYNVNKYENEIQNLKKDLLQANEINKSKLIFLANMSHEMRTPLNSIIGYTQLT